MRCYAGQVDKLMKPGMSMTIYDWYRKLNGESRGSITADAFLDIVDKKIQTRELVEDCDANGRIVYRRVKLLPGG